MLIYLFVANSCNLVDKDHHISFEYLCCVSEISDIAKSKDSHNFLTRNHSVYGGRIINDLTDDLGPGLAKANGKKFADFEDGVLKDLRFSNLKFAFFLFYFLQAHVLFLYFPHCIQRVNRQLSDCIHHFFKRGNCDNIEIMTEEDGCDDEEKAYKNGPADVEVRNLFVVPTDVVCDCEASTLREFDIIGTGICQDVVY